MKALSLWWAQTFIIIYERELMRGVVEETLKVVYILRNPIMEEKGVGRYQAGLGVTQGIWVWA